MQLRSRVDLAPSCQRHAPSKKALRDVASPSRAPQAALQGWGSVVGSSFVFVEFVKACIVAIQDVGNKDDIA